MTEGAKEMVWIRRLLQDMDFQQTEPTSIRSDNLGAITLSNDATYHSRTKHINVAYHFIRERVASNDATLSYVQLKENLADLFTKAVETFQHRYLCEKLGLSGNTEARGSVEYNTSRD
jgi:hypothetical protein